MKKTIAAMMLILASIGYSQAQVPVKTPAQVTAQQKVENLEALQKDLLKEQEVLQAEKTVYYRALRDITEFKKYEEVINKLDDFQRKAVEFQATQQAAIKALDDANQAAANAVSNAKAKAKAKDNK